MTIKSINNANIDNQRAISRGVCDEALPLPVFFPFLFLSLSAVSLHFPSFSQPRASPFTPLSIPSQPARRSLLSATPNLLSSLSTTATHTILSIILPLLIGLLPLSSICFPLSDCAVIVNPNVLSQRASVPLTRLSLFI